MPIVWSSAAMSSFGAAAVLSISLFMICCSSAETQHCVDVSNDVSYKSDDMEGTWYPIEIVLHRNDSKIYGVPLDTNCPAATFFRDPKNKKVLVMIWNSTEGNMEYRFQQKGRGQWQAIIEQKGPSTPAQEQLHGLRASILVLDKDRYMIVRLCSTSIHSSVILSRQNTRSTEVLSAANTELGQLVKYPAHERKPMCNSSVHRTINTLLMSVFVLILLLRI